MHILIIHQAFAAIGEPGGTRHHEFARYLAASGHKITIIASPISYLTGENSGSQRVEKDGDSITIHRVATYSRLHQNFVQRVISFFSFMVSSFIKGLHIDHIDLVWGTSPPIFQGFTAWLLARLKGAKFLFEVRDLWPAFAIEVRVLRNHFLIFLSEWLEKFLYHHADVVMVNSPGFIDHVKNRGAKEVVMIPNGASLQMFSDNSGRDGFRKKHNLQDKTVITYTGAHGMSNDLQVILEAASKLIADNRIHFLFVGDGKEKSNLIKLADEMRLTNVSFFPSVPKSEMSEVLAASDACVAILKPIKMYQTTYPNKVFDCMAAGKPVLLSIDGVIRKVVEEANGGVFCEPGNVDAFVMASKYIADNPDQANLMGERGRMYLKEHFSREKIALDLLSLIERMG